MSVASTLPVPPRVRRVSDCEIRTQVGFGDFLRFHIQHSYVRIRARAHTHPKLGAEIIADPMRHADYVTEYLTRSDTLPLSRRALNILRQVSFIRVHMAG